MATNTQKKSGHTVGFIRDTARHKIGPQRLLMSDHGVTKIYTDLELLLRQIKTRPGDVVAVPHFYMLANPSDVTKLGGLAASALKTMSTLDAIPVSIHELSTGLSSIYIEDRDKMTAAMLVYFQRSRVRSKNKGAPPKPFTQQEQSIIEPIWLHVVKYTTNEIAASAANAALEKAGFKRRVTAKILSYRLGPSGRSRIKAETKRKR